MIAHAAANASAPTHHPHRGPIDAHAASRRIASEGGPVCHSLRVTILCDDVIELDDLPVTSSGPARPVLFREIERQAIEDALRDNDGNRTKTARQLGISLRTLQYRLKEYGITQPKD